MLLNKCFVNHTLTGEDYLRKISGINGQVSLTDALTADCSNIEKKKLEDVPESEEDLDQDGEEIKKIAGKGLNNNESNNSDDLILHLVSTSLSNIHEK